MQGGNPVVEAGKAQGKHRHAEGFGIILRHFAAKGQEHFEGQAHVAGIGFKVALHEFGREAVVARGHRGMGGEYTAGCRNFERRFKGQAVFLHQSAYAFQTGSDCEIINALHRQGAPGDWLNALNGIFAFALWDAGRGTALIARDPIGVCPLYWGHDREGRLLVASEMKAISDACPDVAAFPPGHWYDTATGTPHNRRLFVDMTPLPGRPDGAAVDADGCYWICGNDAGLVHRFTPDGRLDRSLEVPVKKPAMCAFGGAQLDTLYVTSIRIAFARQQRAAIRLCLAMLRAC